MSNLITDGNWAAADVAYRCSEFAAIYPITPSSTMGELADEWAFKGQKNIWGSIPKIIEMQSEGGAIGAVHGALQMGSLATTFTASQGLLLMIPNMYKIAGEHTPFVMHVAARAVATHALSIFGDHSDVMAVRQTGFALLSSHNVQQASDMAAIAHLATQKTRIPFLHFFDGFRTSHEESRLIRISDETLKNLFDEIEVIENRKKGMTPSNPTIRGTAQNPDIFFQSKEASNHLYNNVSSIVQECMNKFKELTGREYFVVEYVGNKNAEHIIVSMGSSCETIEETLNYLNNEKLGLIKIHLYRPFPTEEFLKILPKTVKSIAVLDRTKESGAIGEPLYQDIRTITNSNIKVFGGRYGLGSKEFTPKDVKAIFDCLLNDSLHHSFTVGINDDLTNLSLKTDDNFEIKNDKVKTALLYGIGSDGTVGAVKNIVKIIGENSDLYPQSYAVYDSKKSGGLTVSHIRISDSVIKSQYLVEKADFISVSNFMIIERFDIFKNLKQDGVVLINTTLTNDEIFSKLPKESREELKSKNATIYCLDASKAAQSLGLGNRINTFILINFFKLTKILDEEIVKNSAKEAIKKTYSKKGMEIVQANWNAVDRAEDFLSKVELKGEESNISFINSMTDKAPSFIKNTLGQIASMKGDSLPVSHFKIDGNFGRGEYPTGTAKYEKRGVSSNVATCDLNLCIQCGKCSMMCPHAAIRINVLTDEEKIQAEKDGIICVPMKTKELGENMYYTLNISTLDCTGCNVCITNCPVNALKMISREEGKKQQERFDKAFDLPEIDREKLNLSLPKHIELLPHYFEFPGACGGCGETPYIKLLSHLFGDRMIVANATGCSSIYGGNLPTTPWTKDKYGRGPAWSNSLFEDNAEYGLGMKLALLQKKESLKSALSELNFENLDNIFDEKDINRQREYKKEISLKLKNINNSKSKYAESLLDSIIDKSLWIIGGDGWAYDIGYGGLDHVLHSGENINILVLDTEGYSNTGGQQSKSTPLGASMKFAIGGKERSKKDLGMIAMMSGAYVAQISLGVNQAQSIKAIREAEAFKGPSLILAYAPCIAHGYNLEKRASHEMDMVQSGIWPLYRFNPELIEKGEKALIMDSKISKDGLEDFMLSENRFNIAKSVNSNFGKLVKKAKLNNTYKAKLKEYIANFEFKKD